MSDRDREEVAETFVEGDPLDAQVKMAVKRALRDHKRRRNPIAIWDQDRVKILAPEDIPEG